MRSRVPWISSSRSPWKKPSAIIRNRTPRVSVRAGQGGGAGGQPSRLQGAAKGRGLQPPGRWRSRRLVSRATQHIHARCRHLVAPPRPNLVPLRVRRRVTAAGSAHPAHGRGCRRLRDRRACAGRAWPVHRPVRDGPRHQARRRLLPPRQRRLVREGRDPGRPPATGIWLTLTQEIEKRTTQLIDDAVHASAPAGSSQAEDRRLLHVLHGRSRASRSAGSRPSSPSWPASRASRTRKSLAAYLGSELRADVDALNSGHVHTDRFLGVYVDGT